MVQLTATSVPSNPVNVNSAVVRRAIFHPTKSVTKYERTISSSLAVPLDNSVLCSIASCAYSVCLYTNILEL